MSLNADLLVRVGRFLDGKSTLVELAEWIQDDEEHWATLPADSVARLLADTTMLATYEVDDGARNPDSVKNLLSEASLQPVSG
jgi:hypothetical protein